MNNRHYSKAPVIEAVIDIQTSFSSELPIARLADLADSLKDKFPICTKMTSIQMKVDANEEEDGKISSTQDELGLRLADTVNSRIVQIRKIGFAYSHLPPYSDWRHFSKEARDYWELFAEHCKPEKVTRCAVRYINRIDIGESPVEIDDYLNLYPHIPQEIPQKITGMHLQLQMPQEDLGSIAIINEAIVQPAIPGGLSVIVDIDLFKILSIRPTSEEVWDILEQLRIRKNELFEGFITDNTRGIIQ
jgi:uncharacterized protein (TIGR04255 family)